MLKRRGKKRMSACMRAWRGTALMLAVALAQNMLSGAHRPGGEIQALPAEISAAEARQAWEAGAFILDVRQPEEWDRMHIPGATLIPLGQLEKRLAELPRDKQIVIVCRSGGRSAFARDMLKGAGFDKVASMSGGMLDWQRAGYPTAGAP